MARERPPDGIWRPLPRHRARPIPSTDHQNGENMIQVPGFLLRRLYVRGSLWNADSGFEFELKNGLGSGYADRMLPLTLDGRELPLHHTSFRQESGVETSFAAVDANTPFTLQMN